MENKGHYKQIRTWRGIRNVVKHCKVTGYCSFDFETSGEPISSPTFFCTCIGISFQPGQRVVIPLDHYDSPFKGEGKKILTYIAKHIFHNKDVVKMAWNIQFEHQILMRYNLNLRGVCLDGMLAKHILDEERPHGLKECVERFMPEYAGYGLQGSPSGKAKRETIVNFWSNVELEELGIYCGLDCDLTFRLMMFFERKLIDLGLYQLFINLSMQIAQVLAESSSMGMLVDRKYLEKLEKDYEHKIEDLKESLLNNKRIRKYNRAVKKGKLRKMIDALEEEIHEFHEGDHPNPERLIRSREEKISRLVAGELTTKKELQVEEDVNFNSPPQMLDLLFLHPKGFNFDIVKYTVDKKTKQETDRPSTDEEVLDILKPKDKTGFIEGLLELRGLEKLHSTYMVGILEKLSDQDRIHTSYFIHGTVTGRLSSRNPNMQNIPRGTTAYEVKKMFKPPKGYLILEVDYSQAELRVAAELAKDKTMIDMFNAGYNIHVASAAKSVGMEYEELYPITKDPSHPKYEWANKKKKTAKTINFGVLYEQTAKKLAKTLTDALGEKVPESTAQKFLDDWFITFHKVKKWMDRQHKIAKKQGYVKNIFGRKRRLPNIYSDNYGKRLEAERQSVNAPIQGAASDFTQFSSVLIREERLKGNLPKDLIQVYTVHDSIGFYIKPKDIASVIPKLTKICADPETMKWFGFEMKLVSMKVSPEIGESWSDLKDYDPKFDYSKLV